MNLVEMRKDNIFQEELFDYLKEKEEEKEQAEEGLDTPEAHEEGYSDY